MTNRHHPLLPGATIGIIGAGQLGKMLAQSAQKMGYNVAMYDPNPQSCGFAVSHRQVVADFSNKTALLDFVKSVDVVTYEFENIDGELLAQIETEANLPQGTQLLRHSQHRLEEKSWLNSIGVPVVKYAPVTNMTTLQQAIDDIGLPAILKTSRFGYDGKGQIRLQTQDDVERLQAALAQLMQSDCILESYCPFEYEISVIVSRDMFGDVAVFPISENLHEQGVLCMSVVPSARSHNESITQRVNAIATTIAHKGELVGVCGIEFFVLQNGDVLVNEIAPRPHNTGHYSIEGTSVSQFDQHILAITGRHLMPIELLSPTVMVNILGQHMSQLATLMQEYPDAMLHIYDKGDARRQRKMGHFTWRVSHTQPIDDIVKSSPFLQNWGAQYRD